MSGEVLRARLATGAARLARAWEVERKDGVRLGFTDHDRDLEFGGVVFEAEAGLDAGTLERSTGLAVDNGQAVGALTSDRVREADILAGRYDGAVVRHWVVDWADVEARTQVFEGSLGEIRAGSGRFEAELRGLSEALNHPVGRAYLRTCDRDLGDQKCGVDTGDPLYAATGVVVELEGRQAVMWSPEVAYADGWFAGGSLVWETGANAGLSARVRSDQAGASGRRLVLWAEAKAEVVVGDGFRVVAGCDKRLETCRTKFGNALNFRGFPHMPGEDWVTAYPRGGSGPASQHWDLADE